MVLALFRTLEFKKAFQLPIYYKYWRFFFLPRYISQRLRMYLLLYYLYCLCKSVQRSLVLRLLFFSKADAKVRTLFHIFQIFSEVFFYFFSFFESSLLRKEEQRKRTVVTARISKRLSNNAALILKAGAKVRTLFHILQINLKFFFIFLFKGGIHETNSTK